MARPNQGMGSTMSLCAGRKILIQNLASVRALVGVALGLDPAHLGCEGGKGNIRNCDASLVGARII